MSLLTDSFQLQFGNKDDNEAAPEMSPAPITYNNIMVNIPAVTIIQVSSTLSTQQPGNEIENDGGGRQSPKSIKLGKMFFPLTIQASLSALNSISGGLSATAEAKQLLRVAVISNTVGYIGCLADILLRHRCKKAANIMGRIGSGAALFGFLTMMGTLLGLKPVVLIGAAAFVTVIFFVAVTKQQTNVVG